MYVPKPGEEGFLTVKGVLREYILADLTEYGLPSVVEFLPGGVKGFIDEGTLTETTPTPVILCSTIGDGQSEQIRTNSLVRFILYVIDRGRGLYYIERILHRMRMRLNASSIVLNYMLFPPESDIRIENIEASGSTSSTSLPAWKAEARGLYVFVTVKGLEADYWET